MNLKKKLEEKENEIYLMLDEKKSLKNENSLLKMNIYKFESEK